MRYLPIAIVVVSTVVLGIGPYFFGINYWYFEKLSEGEFEEVEALLREIPVDVIRIGGMWYDAHGIKSWVLRDFFDLCESLNATPIVQIPFNGKSTEDLVSFVEKVREIYDGKIVWSIGNEMDIYKDMDADWLVKEDFRTFMEKYGRFVERLRSLEKDAFLIGPDFSWKWRPWAIGDWTTPYLKRYRDEIEVFVVHRYPFRYVFKSSEIVRDVQEYYAEMKRLKSKLDMEIGLTETNLSWDWNYCGPLSPEGEWAGMWYASILIRSMVLDLWNVSIWSTVNDSCLSMISIEGKEVTTRPTYEVLRLFKGVPRDLKDWYLSKYVDYVILGNTLLVINRSDKVVPVKVGSDIIEVGRFSFSRYERIDGKWKMVRSWTMKGGNR